MNKMLLLGIFILGMMMSCSNGDNDIKIRTYKVMTPNNVKVIAINKELRHKLWLFDIGDTVMMDNEYSLNKGNTKVVIIGYID